jgi:signal transduction histidine kinase
VRSNITNDARSSSSKTTARLRAQSATSSSRSRRRNHGTGLGLAIVQKVIVSPALITAPIIKGGAQFQVRLPIASTS